jgi:large subunit ribosomal protein L21
MYAVIKTGGKQYQVAKGDTLKVERLHNELGENVVFDEVLLLVDGEKVQIGNPILPENKVKATVVAHSRGPKIRVFKFRRRKNSVRQRGHRQDFTLVKIEEIS